MITPSNNMVIAAVYCTISPIVIAPIIAFQPTYKYIAPMVILLIKLGIPFPIANILPYHFIHF